MIRSATGQPFVGYVQLTNGTPAASIPIYILAGSATAYTLKSNEKICLCGFMISSNDTATPLIQITDQAATPKILASAYGGGPSTAPAPPATAALPAGIVLGSLATNLKAVAASITAAKTAEINIYGYVFVP
jgi:hypothetical protein